MRELWKVVLDEMHSLYVKGAVLEGAIIRIKHRDEVIEYRNVTKGRKLDEVLKVATSWVEGISREHQRKYDECVFVMEIENELRLDYHNVSTGYNMVLGIPKHGDGKLNIDGIYGMDKGLDVECLANLNYRIVGRT